MRGVGQIDHIFWHNDNTAFIKKNIPVLYCLSHDKDLKFQFKIKIITFANKEVKHQHGQFDPPPLMLLRSTINTIRVKYWQQGGPLAKGKTQILNLLFTLPIILFSLCCV